jgi:hypothetical protein
VKIIHEIEYLAEMSRGMIHMARRSRMPLAAYLFEMVYIETTNQARLRRDASEGLEPESPSEGKRS